MESLKVMAVVYETTRQREFKSVLDKLTFGAHCFAFIRIDPQQESSYSIIPDSELSEMLEMKLDAVQEIFVINPKGTITPYLRSILNYAEENEKPVHYMYKYCYNDCAFRKKKECTKTSEIFFAPHSHKLLPACESYARIYDSLIVGGSAKEDTSKNRPANAKGSPAEKNKK